MKNQFKNPTRDMSAIALFGLMLIVLAMSSCSRSGKMYSVINIASYSVKTVSANGTNATPGDMVKMDKEDEVISSCKLAAWKGKVMEENRWVVLEVIKDK